MDAAGIAPKITPEQLIAVRNSLVAFSLGLSRLIADDHAQLQQGMFFYDALYLWCKEGQDEQHSWNPEACR